MEEITLILIVLPVIFISTVIALAFFYHSLSKFEITPTIKYSVIFLLYMIYAYVTLSFSYNLMGFYSYTFVLETIIAFYFFPSFGNFLYLTTPVLTMIYYPLVGSYNSNEEIYFLILGVSLFFFTSFLKNWGRLEMVYEVIATFIFKFFVIVVFYLLSNQMFASIIDHALILVGSLIITAVLWSFYRLKQIEDDRMRNVINQSQIDALTGAFNFQKLGADLLKFQENKQFFSLAMIDLDYFKELNDTFGHSEGNEVLKEFAELLNVIFTQRRGKGNFAVYRFGGEEFCVILFDCTKKEAQQEFKHFKKNYMKHHRLLSKGYAITFSVGIESNKIHHYDGMKTMEYADAALYDAKRAGRNQIHLYTSTNAYR